MAEKINGSPPKLRVGRLTPAEHARREMVASIPAGTKLADILKPDYWAHYTADLVPNTIVEAMCEDGSWEASLRVMYVSATEVQMQVRWDTTYDKVEPKDGETETHEIKWISPSNKFAVVRKADNMVVRDGFYPRKQAQKFLQTLT